MALRSNNPDRAFLNRHFNIVIMWDDPDKKVEIKAAGQLEKIVGPAYYEKILKKARITQTDKTTIRIRYLKANVVLYVI